MYWYICIRCTYILYRTAMVKYTAMTKYVQLVSIQDGAFSSCCQVIATCMYMYGIVPGKRPWVVAQRRCLNG